MTNLSVPPAYAILGTEAENIEEQTSTVFLKTAIASNVPPIFGISFIIGFGIFIFSSMIFGILSNSLTFIVIRRTPELRRSHFMKIISSLCISDLLSAVISPLFWYRRSIGYDVWVPPKFFCKLFWAVDNMTSLSTSMHILSFAILRYLAIRHYSTYAKITKKFIFVWIRIIWLIAFFCGFIPYYILFGAKPGVEKRRSQIIDNWPACSLKPKWLDIYKTYAIVDFSIFFSIPMLGVIIISILIARAVHVHSTSYVQTNNEALNVRMRKKKQAVRQLVLIVISFLMGYIPYVSYEIWSRRHAYDATRAEDHWFCITQYICLRLSECLNPVFYSISSSKMREYTRNFLQQIFTSSRRNSEIITRNATPSNGEQKIKTIAYTKCSVDVS